MQILKNGEIIFFSGKIKKGYRQNGGFIGVDAKAGFWWSVIPQTTPIIKVFGIRT